MALLIDAYNLLHAPMPPALAGLDSAGLCRLLGRPAARQHLGHRRILVVCDGNPGDGRPAKSPDDSVQLLYAGRKRSADDLICQLIDADSAPRRLTVVSSDRRIRQAARRRRAKVLRSDQFVAVLSSVATAPRRRDGAGDAKPAAGPLDAEQVQKWLAAFAVDSGATGAERRRLDRGIDADPGGPSNGAAGA